MFKRMQRIGKNKKGLALSELMVATTILSMALVAVGNVYMNGQQSYYFIEGSAKNVQEVRLAADQITRDIRTTIQITSATATSLTVTGDYNGDGTSDTISFVVTAGILNRTVNSSSKQVASGIVNTYSQPVFKYYDQDGNSATDGTQAKLIELDLRIDKDTQRSPSRSTQLVTKIQLRNLHERR